MINTRNDVKDFMVAGDQVDFEFGPQSDLYMNLITEEVIHETLRDFDKKDLVGIADGIADSIWVIEGSCISLQLDLQGIWERVNEWVEVALDLDGDLKQTVCNVLIEYSRVRMEYILENKEFIDDDPIGCLIEEYEKLRAKTFDMSVKLNNIIELLERM